MMFLQFNDKFVFLLKKRKEKKVLKKIVKRYNFISCKFGEKTKRKYSYSSRCLVETYKNPSSNHGATETKKPSNIEMLPRNFS